MHAGPAAAGGPTDAAGREGLVDQVGNLVLGDKPAAVAGAGEPAAAAPVAGEFFYGNPWTGVPFR